MQELIRTQKHLLVDPLLRLGQRVLRVVAIVGCYMLLSMYYGDLRHVPSPCQQLLVIGPSRGLFDRFWVPTAKAPAAGQDTDQNDSSAG